MEKQQYDAYTQLVFSPINGRTISTERYFTGNARVSARLPMEENGAYHMLITTGGGLVEGEKYKVDVEVKENAHALLVSQAPTYLFRCLEHKQTIQETNLKVEEKGILEFLMDDLIPYETANFWQKNEIHLAKNASLIYLDGVTAGWAENQLPFQYEELRLETKVYVEEELIFYDHFYSSPKKQGELERLGVLEGKTNYNSLIVIHPEIDENFIDELRAELKGETSLYGISELEKPGFVVRILGDSVDENKHLIYRCANFVRQQLFHLPSYTLRKNDYYEQIC